MLDWLEDFFGLVLGTFVWLLQVSLWALTTGFWATIGYSVAKSLPKKDLPNKVHGRRTIQAPADIVESLNEEEEPMEVF